MKHIVFLALFDPVWPSAKTGSNSATKLQASSASTYSSNKPLTSKSESVSFEYTKPSVGRLKRPELVGNRSACRITVSDKNVMLHGAGRCGDASDDNSISPKLAKSAVLKRTGMITAIVPLTIQVALSANTAAQTFTFSKKKIIPGLSLHLAVSQLALFNVSFLVAEADHSCKDLRVGNIVLQLLGIDCSTLLDLNCKRLDGIDLERLHYFETREKLSTVGLLLLLRLKRRITTNLRSLKGAIGKIHKISSGIRRRESTSLI